MRLLNTTTLTFEEFFDADRPVYSILSHRWGKDEVSYLDFCEDRMRDGKGFEKIAKCCEISSREGIDWCWVDTCCIDKRSSAELTEAINSMYQWYQESCVCYAFLPDVHPLRQDAEILGDEMCQESDQTAPFLLHELKQSVWFHRGWTLQELLAPPRLLLFNTAFALISKDLRSVSPLGSSMTKVVSAASGIEVRFLGRSRRHSRGIAYEAGVAECMKWASRRQTTRKEDMAYCLLGLFDVNMPLLYGEGDKAFVRLQLEILKKSDDDSIFAWTRLNGERAHSKGLLATSPKYFKHTGTISPGMELQLTQSSRAPYAMTSKGLVLQVYFPEVERHNGVADQGYALIEYELEQVLIPNDSTHLQRLSVRLCARDPHKNRSFPTNSIWTVLPKSALVAEQPSQQYGWDLPVHARFDIALRPKWPVKMLRVHGHGYPSIYESSSSSEHHAQRVYFKRVKHEPERWVLTKIYVPQDGV